MRVLHTIDSLRSETGGPARTVPALAGALANQGLQIDLWARDWPADFQAPAHVKTHTGSLAALLGAGEIRADIWHEHGIWLRTNHEACRLAARAGTPRVVSPRGMLEPWALRHRRWKKKIAWWLYQRGDLQRAAALHATAEAEAAQFRRLGLRSPITVIPNGVAIPDRARRPRSGDRMRTALFLSRVHPKKGLPLLVEAWAKVRPEGWLMRVVGPDEQHHSAEVKMLAQQAGLAETWEFTGEISDREKWQVYELADLFILPSYSENFGMAVAEALSAGLPVITTKGCPWEGLQRHDCGRWVAPTVDGLAAGLRELCAASDDELLAMGQRGRRWMESEFSWNKIAERMTGLYEAVLQRTKT